MVARGMFGRGVGAAAVWVAMAGSAAACAFHLYAPAATTIDQIVDAQVLILAREDPDEAFFFEALGALRGETAAAPKVEHLVDSATRRKLMANPEDAVLFGWDEISGEWARLAYVGAQYTPVLEAMLSIADAPEADRAAMRLGLAEALQDHPRDEFRRIALEEFDAASYGDLRNVDLRLSAEEISSRMWSLTEAPWLPIRALMLGMTDEDLARDMLYEDVDRQARRGASRNLGPWATALMEIDGTQAVEHLSALFFEDPSRDITNVETVLSAMAVQSSEGSVELDDAITQAVAELVAARPETAGAVARQFYATGDFSQATALNDALKTGAITETADVILVSVYLAKANGGADAEVGQ